MLIYIIIIVLQKRKNKTEKMKALIGVLIFSGVKKNNHSTVSEIWDVRCGTRL